MCSESTLSANSVNSSLSEARSTAWLWKASMVSGCRSADRDRIPLCRLDGLEMEQRREAALQLPLSRLLQSQSWAKAV